MEGVTATNGKEKVMFEHKTEEEARKHSGKAVMLAVSFASMI